MESARLDTTNDMGSADGTTTSFRPASTPAAAAPATWERLMTRLGSPGKFQTLIFVLLASNYIAVAFNHLFPKLYGQRPSAIYCVPNQFDFGTHGKIKTNNHKFVEYSCPQRFEPTINRTMLDEACESSYSSGFVYEYPKTGQFSIAAEWDLTCSNEKYINWATTIYFAGVMTGGLLFGYLADRFGRRPILFICMLGEAVFGIIYFAATSYTTFVVLKFLQGVLLQGMQSTSYVLMMEYFHSRHRTLVGTIAEDFWALGVILLALIGYMFGHWRHIQLVCSLLSLLGLFYFFILEESLRWLLTQQRSNTRARQQALRVAHRICKFNGLSQHNYSEIEAMILNDAKSYNNAESLHSNKPNGIGPITDEDSHNNNNVMPFEPTIYAAAKNKKIDSKSFLNLLFYHAPVLRFRTITMSFIWLATSCVYYGLSFVKIGDNLDIYLTLLINGVTEAIAYTLSAAVLCRYGRRRPLCCYFMIAGTLCIVVVFISPQHHSVWHLLACIVGRMGVAAAMSVIFLYATELFPTVVRNLSYGLCVCFLRLGAMLAPQIITGGASLFAEFPYIIFGLMAFVAACVVMLLPETHGRPLPDELSDIEVDGWGRAAATASVALVNADDDDDDDDDEYDSVDAVECEDIVVPVVPRTTLSETVSIELHPTTTSHSTNGVTGARTTTLFNNGSLNSSPKSDTSTVVVDDD